MILESPVETLTASLVRRLLALRQRQATPPAGRPQTGARAPLGVRLPSRIDTLGNGQMLLPGIAEPRLWSIPSPR